MSIRDALEAGERAPLSDAELIEELQHRGYISHKPQPAVKPAHFDLSRLQGERITLGVISDLHIGSKFSQPSLLVEHLRYFKTAKVDAICVAGDITDGSPKMHPGFEYETWALGADAQVNAAADLLIPEADRLKVPWYLIGGNHDASHWKAAGVDVVDALCSRSEWFNYLQPGGGNFRDSVGHVRFGALTVQLCHPHMGSAYALSYRPQRWIEALAPENKPNIILMGNFHKVLQMDYRNVYALLLPAFQAQSAWMASKGIASYVGSCVLEVGTDLRGLAPLIGIKWLVERVIKENDWPGA